MIRQGAEGTEMVSFERFEEMTYELAQQLPPELFRRLDGGVMAREEVKIHPEAVADDLLILGEYHRDPHLSRFVVLYYGSFMRSYGHLDEAGLRKEMWRVLRHEFLHHIESLAGERGLEIRDAVQLAQYKKEHGGKTDDSRV